jgi:membrane-bound lytic murein transglycosylase D
VLALQRAGSYYERGIQAMRNGDADRAEWEFDIALETLLEMNLTTQAPGGLLGAARTPLFPASILAAPPRSPSAMSSEPPEKDDPPLEAPALLSPEDVQAMATAPAADAASLLEPEGEGYDIPVVFNDAVKTFLQYFQTRKWGVISRAFERASRYLPMMRNIFQEKGLPEDLLNLAFIESAVNPRATSRAKAAGIWQFMPSTARLYGMRASWWLDERRDPEKSTRAAAEYLGKLYRLFDSWPLALAAYNAGEGKIQRAIQRQKTRDFWSLRLPKETQLFVPAFMAMTVIARNPERFGFFPPPVQPAEVETLVVRHPTDLGLIARAARTTVDHIRELNPELIRGTTPLGTSRYAVRIPAGTREEVEEALDRIPPAERVAWIPHRIRKGETPATVARKHQVALQAVLDLNGLHKRQAVKPGEVLLIPTLPGTRVASAPPGPSRAKAAPARPIAPQRYVVKKGDTLSSVARTYGVSPHDLRRRNNLPRNAALRPGQILQIPPAAS